MFNLFVNMTTQASIQEVPEKYVGREEGPYFSIVHDEVNHCHPLEKQQDCLCLGLLSGTSAPTRDDFQ